MVLFAARRSSSVSSRRMKTKQFLKLKVSEVREKKLAPPEIKSNGGNTYLHKEVA